MELSVHHIITDKHWDDLVLSPGTIREILELKEWISNQRTTIVASAEKSQGGNHVVFYGPAGSGKMLTASLLARESGKALYRIDLSDAASKYIGETEKNLDAFFSRADNEGWILFFDEADALFGKKTETQESGTGYADLESSYFLRRIRDYEGLIIFSVKNLPDSGHPFSRHIHQFIQFPIPAPAERKRLWEMGFSKSKLISERLDLDAVAEKFHLTPGAILQAAHSVIEKMPSLSTSATAYEILLGELRRQQEIHKAGNTPEISARR